MTKRIYLRRCAKCKTIHRTTIKSTGAICQSCKRKSWKKRFRS